MPLQVLSALSNQSTEVEEKEALEVQPELCVLVARLLPLLLWPVRPLLLVLLRQWLLVAVAPFAALALRRSDTWALWSLSRRVRWRLCVPLVPSEGAF